MFCGAGDGEDGDFECGECAAGITVAESCECGEGIGFDADIVAGESTAGISECALHEIDEIGV